MDIQSNQAKIAEALRLKELGNQHFKEKEYKKALTAYHQANLYLTGLQEKGSSYYSYNKDYQLNDE
jgi:hypothetical protein